MIKTQTLAFARSLIGTFNSKTYISSADIFNVLKLGAGIGIVLLALSVVNARAATSLKLSPTSLTFGNQLLHTSSAAQNVTLTNTGSTSLSLTSVTVGGTDPSDFGETNTCGSSVAPGANCTISVTFTDKARGTRSASLSVADNASGSPQTVALSGTGTIAELTPSSLSFGSETVGSTTSAQTITVTNLSITNPIKITSITLTGANAGDFSETNTCPASLGVSALCVITVKFKPTATGTRSAAVTINDNGGGLSQSASLNGTGTTSGTPAVTLSPTSLSFANTSIGSTSELSVTLTNSGTASLTVSSATESGAGFTLSKITTPLTLAAGQSASFSVTFAPTAAKTYSGSVSLSTNAVGSPSTEALTGTGVTATEASVVLTWDASTSQGVTGYNVYRGGVSGGPYTLLTTSPISGTTYTDNSVTAGDTYYYVTTSVSDTGDSGYSNQATAVVPN